MNWLSETEKQLDDLNAEATVNDPDKIKQRYAIFYFTCLLFMS